MNTAPIFDFVDRVLASIKAEDITEDITDDVCLKIERTPVFLSEYKELVADLTKGTVNATLSQAVGKGTNRCTDGRLYKPRSSLMKRCSKWVVAK